MHFKVNSYLLFIIGCAYKKSDCDNLAIKQAHNSLFFIDSCPLQLQKCNHSGGSYRPGGQSPRHFYCTTEKYRREIL